MPDHAAALSLGADELSPKEQRAAHLPVSEILLAADRLSVGEAPSLGQEFPLVSTPERIAHFHRI